MHTRLFAVVATVGLVLFALGPGAATVAADGAGNDALDVSVDQADEEPTVTVTDNGTAVENATVTVEALDNGTYEGANETYSTDANGTVTLPEPEENVSVEVTATAGTATGSTTVDLTVAGENETDTFGQRVSAFVQSLVSGNSTGIGQQVAEFVTENNPGNAPAWAGPPADGERGPPEHAGQDDDSGNETDDDRRGPPADAGPPEDRGDDSDDVNETEDDEVEDEEETDEDPNETDDDSDEETDDDSDEETDDEDDSGGPPEQAKGNGN